MTAGHQPVQIEPSLLANTSRLFGANVFSLGTALVINILYARYLGPAGLGWYTLALYLPEMAALFLNLGLPVANIYLVGGGQVSGSQALSSSLGLGAILALLASILYVVLLPWLQPTILQGLPHGLATLGTLALPLNLAMTIAGSLLMAQERLGEFSLVKVGQGLVCLASILVLVIGLNLGYWGAVLSYLLALTVALAAIFRRLSSTIKLQVSLHGATLRKQLSYGLKGHLGTVVQFFNYRIDLLLVAYFLGPRELGLYSLATLVAETLWQVANAAQTALFPRIASTRGSTEVTLQVLSGVVALTALGALLLLFLGRTLIPLFFSAAFLESYGAMAWLLPGIVALCYGKILSADLLGRGYAWVGTIGSGAALPVTLGLNLVLIPRLGIQGAAMTSSLSYIIIGLVMSIIFIRVGKISYTAIIATLNPFNWWRVALDLVGRRRKEAWVRGGDPGGS